MMQMSFFTVVTEVDVVNIEVVIVVPLFVVLLKYFQLMSLKC